MSIRINSFSSAPVNNNINKTNKPKVAFGNAAACMDTLQTLKQRFSSESLHNLRRHALHVNPEDKLVLNQQLKEFVSQKGIKPVLVKAVDTIFGVKIQ